MVVAASLVELLTAIGAATAGVAACLSAWAALARTRREEKVDCEERLARLRRELKELAK